MTFSMAVDVRKWPSQQPQARWLSSAEAIPSWDWQLSWGLAAGSTTPAGGESPSFLVAQLPPRLPPGCLGPCSLVPIHAYKNPTLNGQDWERRTAIHLKQDSAWWWLSALLPSDHSESGQTSSELNDKITRLHTNPWCNAKSWTNRS